MPFDGSTNPPSRLRLSAEGLAIARGRFSQLFSSQADLATEANVDRATVWRFFKCINLRFDSFDSICTRLRLRWDEVGESPDTLANSSTNAFATGVETTPDALVSQVRTQLANYIRHDCGQVALWGHSPGKPMEDIFIHVEINVNPSHPFDVILDEPTLTDTSEEEDNSEIFDRTGHGNSTQLMSGLQAAQTIQLMYLDGKPGSGKTTYLKWMALQCSQGNLLPDYVPVFLSCGVFVEEPRGGQLRSHIVNYFARRNIPQPETVTDKLLRHGRLLVILDSFDDLPEDIRGRIRTQLLDLVARYQQCHFIVSCRPPLRLHLVGFQRVEIAEFRRPQITEFAKRWFELMDGYDRSDRFLDRLRKHRAIGEMAKTPLLLPMLCSVFAIEGEFPKNRMSLYRKGFDILLSEWDTSQHRHRDSSYAKLSNKAKVVLLSEIATHFFRNGKVLFHRYEVEAVVEKFFIERLKKDPLEVNATEILAAIELQHGLLIRRAVNYYSFSHLTFQEYLTASNLKDTKRYPILYDCIVEERWQYVIEMVAELLSADQVHDFILNLKQRLDELLVQQSKLTEFLHWLDQFVEDAIASYDQNSVQQRYRKTLLRAHYFVASLGDEGHISGFTSITKRHDLEFPDYLAATSMLRGQLIEIHTHLFRIFYAKTTEPDMFFGVLKRLKKAIEPLEDLQIQNSLESWDVQIQQQLQNFSGRSEWWSARHNMWRKRAREFMNRYFQLRCDWNFSDSERQLLRQYYNGTKLLAECLNLSKISKDHYGYIAESLLRLEQS